MHINDCEHLLTRDLKIESPFVAQLTSVGLWGSIAAFPQVFCFVTGQPAYAGSWPSLWHVPLVLHRGDVAPLSIIFTC